MFCLFGFLETLIKATLSVCLLEHLEFGRIPVCLTMLFGVLQVTAW
jgi:hypothetical protein